MLVCVVRDPAMRLREIADCVRITERAAHRIVCELEEAGYLTRRREGRRNVYDVRPQVRLPHALEQQATVGDLLAAVGAAPDVADRRSDGRPPESPRVATRR